MTTIDEVLAMLSLQHLGFNDIKDFHRHCILLRSPEGFGKDKHCPNCKEPIVVAKDGDMRCSNYSLHGKHSDHEHEPDKCIWHRHKDGTHYWSKPMDIIKARCKEDPIIRAKMEKQFPKEMKEMFK